MSAMVNLEVPWINIMSKMDLVSSNPDEVSNSAKNALKTRKDIARYVVPVRWALWFNMAIDIWIPILSCYHGRAEKATRSIPGSMP